MALHRHLRTWLMPAALATAACLVSCERPTANSNTAGNNHQEESRAAESGDSQANELMSAASRRLFERFRKAMKARNYESAAEALAQISEREPHNLDFRKFHAHHLGYNIAAEMVDDPAGKYLWKRRAILVFIDGLDRNPQSVELWSDLAWYVGVGIGRNLEAKGLRERFAADGMLHQRLAPHVDLSDAAGPDGKPANFLVSKLLAAKAIEISERTGQFPENRPPLLLHNSPPTCQVWHARALQEDGYAGRSIAAWKHAAQLFKALEQQPGLLEDKRVCLADDTALIERLVLLGEQLDALRPKLRQRVISELALHSEPLNSVEERLLRRASQHAMDVPDARYISVLGKEQLRNELGAPQDSAALELAEQAAGCYRQLEDIVLSRAIINLDDWQLRCDIEQDPAVSRSRELLRQADEAYRAGRFDDANAANPGARQLYQQAFAHFADAQSKNPDWADCNSFWSDLDEAIKIAKSRFGAEVIPASLLAAVKTQIEHGK